MQISVMNFNFEDARNALETELAPERYLHSIGVMETATELAERFGANVQKAKIAGLLHDCAKNIDPVRSYGICGLLEIELDDVTKQSYKLVHQYLGAELAKMRYGIDDEEILSAIRTHTTAKEEMSLLDKVIYLADFIEPNRNKKPFEGLCELREICKKDIDEAMLFALDISIKSITERKMLLHMDTVLARNWFLSKKISKTLEK